MTIARICGFAALVLALPAHPQVVLDGTLGPSGALSGPNYSIPHTLGQQVGGNLFHSFRSFNLTSTQSATFTGLAGTSNVISRVTGGTFSSINGQLNSTIAGANFYFINPSGIVFGPSARLNVQGAFHASTAGYLRLAGSDRFDAVNPGSSTLTSAAPSAFGFYSAPAPIVLQGDLKLLPGQTLSLIGGDLFIRDGGRVWAPGGRINLASAASAGEITLSASGIGGTVSSYGDITLTGVGRVLTDNPSATPNTVAGGPAGPIYIRGGQLSLTNSAISARNEAGAGSNVDITLTGDLSMSGSVIRSSAIWGGDAGDTLIRAANVTMTRGSIIETSSVDLSRALGGRAGATSIEAQGDVLLAEGATITSISFFGPAAGEMRIRARNLTLTGGSTLNASTFGDGDGGSVLIDVGNLQLAEGGKVLAGSLFSSAVSPGDGAGGNIVVNASGNVDISGPGSGLFSVTDSFGPGGTIAVSAANVRVAGGGRISSASSDPHGFGAVGNAGSIDVAAAERITLEGDGAITTEALTAGGGIINLSAGQVLSLTDSRITTSVADGAGNGGDINIDPVFVVLNNSQIIAQAFGGNGGDITIVTQFLIMSPDSIIDASSRFGLSGKVVVTAPSLDVGARLGVLSSAYVDPASRLRESCATRAGAGNSFVGVGRGGLPASPQSAAFAAYGAFAPLAAAELPADKTLACPS